MKISRSSGSKIIMNGPMACKSREGAGEGGGS